MSRLRLSQYFARTGQLLRDNTTRVLRMEGADEPSRTPKLLFKFHTNEDIQDFATGCDADIGGMSSVRLELDKSNPALSARTYPSLTQSGVLDAIRTPTGKFWGDMKLSVHEGLQGKIRGGYAGFRSKPRPSLFGEVVDDVSNHRYLALRLRVAGSQRTRNSYYVNIQTDGPISTDLWQHRIFFKRADSGWEDVFIPFDDFVLTNAGEISRVQVEMFKERVRTVGISLLGGNSGVSGPYELGIESIRAVNEEDIPPDAVPGKEASAGTPWERPPV